MPNYRFSAGARIALRGREYTVEQRLQNGDLQIKDALTGNLFPEPEESLIEALFDDQLEFLGDGGGNSYAQVKASKSFIRDLSSLPDSDTRKAEAKRRYRYVREVLSSDLKSLTRRTLTPLSERVSAELSDKKRPSWRTLCRWVKAFLDSGEDIRALIPGVKSQGNRKPRYSGRRKLKGEGFSTTEKKRAERVAKIIDDVIKEKYLSRRRPSPQTTYEAILARIQQENRFRQPDDELPIPSKSSLYAKLRKIDPYERDAARYGKRFADQRHMAVMGGPRPKRALERVEIDHTKLDLFVVDPETGLPIGRPWLTIAIDVYTKMIVGMYLSFNPPSYLSVMRCLLHAIMPKSYVKKQYPAVVNSWEAYGIPETVVVDNGKEFHSSHFEDACLQLGILVQYAPPLLAWFKGTVERYFNSLNKELLHEQPGTTFSKALKGDYDPMKNAIISLDTLLEIVHIFIVDYYHQREHRSLEDIPALLWKQSVEEYPPALPPQREDLQIMLGHVESRELTRLGIEFQTIRYNSEDRELARLKRRMAGRKVKFKYDPADLGCIYIFDEVSGEYLTMPALDPEYASGLTLWQHSKIRELARASVKSKVNRAALLDAKEKIRKTVEQDLKKMDFAKTRAKIARWLGMGQQIEGEMYIDEGGARQAAEKAVAGSNKTPPASRGSSDYLGGISSPSPGAESAEDYDGATEFEESEGLLETSDEKRSSTGQHNARGGRRNSGRRRRGNRPATSSRTDESRYSEKGEPLPAGDFSVDTTGWEADYDLPQTEGIR